MIFFLLAVIERRERGIRLQLHLFLGSMNEFAPDDDVGFVGTDEEGKTIGYDP
jgi:hypothetical protein